MEITKVDLSIVVPAFNEEKNLLPLYSEIVNALRNIKKTYEIIFVDDGSKDNTVKVLEEIKKKDKNFKFFSFKKNYGQTQAMAAGVHNSKGKYIITLDADLQNPPEEIPNIIAKAEEKNYDCVSGWRKHRKDDLKKKMFSRLSYRIRRLLFKDRVHDAGCTLKIYKKECFDDFEFYGESHRFITTILQLKGFKVGECVVKHRKRIAGKTKYNAKRLIKGFLDLIFIKFWNDFSTRPIHFFGYFTFFQYSAAAVILMEQILKALINSRFEAGPLFLLFMLLILNGTITFFFGFLAEIIIRMKSEGKKGYTIK